jgi:hypothetical protein
MKQFWVYENSEKKMTDYNFWQLKLPDWPDLPDLPDGARWMEFS